MNPALWAAKTGLDAQQTRLAVTSNNLANVSTSGFKKGRAVFEDLLYQNVRQVGGSTSQDTEAPSGVHLGTGVRVVATEKLYTQGGLTQTDNALDVAIEGRGFFQIQMPDGTTTYTRDGSFQLSAQGQMVTSSGYVLQPGISIPDGSQSITIGRDGVVSVRVAGQAAPGAGRPAAAHGLREPGRPAAAGRKPAGRDRRQRSRADRHARPERPRRHHAGLGRSVERQRGRRAGQHDRDAARLRNELEGDLDRRPDARIREQPVMKHRSRPAARSVALDPARRLRHARRKTAAATSSRAGPTKPRRRKPLPGAIYAQGTDVSLWKNVTARNVGDTLTIRLAESTEAEKTATHHRQQVQRRRSSPAPRSPAGR